MPPDGELNEPTEKYGCTIPRKNARPRNARKSWQHFEHLRASTVVERYEEEALRKARVGTNAPMCSVGLSGCTSSWLLPAVQGVVSDAEHFGALAVSRERSIGSC